MYLDKSDVRVCNRFFLQYLWELAVGMILADLYYHGKKINLPKKSYLIIGGMCGIFITGVTGIMGGYLKSFNDTPSVI